ncbi:MAG TPA: AAA family ATPase, partial [Kofleriaceae bacterium]|nr:AAA family ATPase [Kofleriaceae bacterium]
MRIERLSVRNYRALHAIDLSDLTPLTVLLGPNGSGKSTLFDVFSFLSECFTDGLPRAWDRRGRFRELRTRGSKGPIVFELEYREDPKDSPATYHLEIDETGRGEPVVAVEWLKWRRVAPNEAGAPYKVLFWESALGGTYTQLFPDEPVDRAF